MKKVLCAHMHETSFLKGIGPVPTTLDPSAMKGLKMNLVRPGIIAEWKGRTFILPYHLFKSIELDPTSLDDSKDAE